MRFVPCEAAFHYVVDVFVVYFLIQVVVIYAVMEVRHMVTEVYEPGAYCDILRGVSTCVHKVHIARM